MMYPKHMVRAVQAIRRYVRATDIVLHVIDARAPQTTRSEQVAKMVPDRPVILILMKPDLAEEAATRRWLRVYQQSGLTAAVVNGRTGKGASKVMNLAVETGRSRFSSRRCSPVRAMVVGLPNTGKSTLINRLAGRRAAVTGGTPGVTRGEQWIRASNELLVLDLPGVLAPRARTAADLMKLAALGIVPEQCYQVEEVATWLAGELRLRGLIEKDPCLFVREFGRARGLLCPGGTVDMERSARTLIAAFRAGELGRITFDWPD